MAKKKFRQNVQVRRIFAIIRILIRRRTPATLAIIADELRELDIEVPSSRTLARDMDEIAALGYHIDLGKGKGYLLQNKEEIAGLFFGAEEVQALQMSRSVFRYFEGTHIKKSVDDALSMVTGLTLSNYGKAYLDELEDGFMVHLGPHRDLRDKGDIIDDIIYCINSKMQLQLGYQKPNSEADEGIVEPYRLILYKDTLYLLAEKITGDHSGDTFLRVYHISRVTSAEPMDTAFERSEKLLDDFEEKLSHSFGIMAFGELTDITLTFDKVVLSALQERTWHDSQEIIEVGDQVVMKLKVLDSREFISWLLGWGKELVKVEPEELAERMLEMRG